MITTRQIAACAGMKSETVGNTLRRLGIKGNRGGKSAGYPNWALDVVKRLSDPFWKVSVMNGLGLYEVKACSLSMAEAAFLAGTFRKSGKEARATPQLLFAEKME